MPRKLTRSTSPASKAGDARDVGEDIPALTVGPEPLDQRADGVEVTQIEDGLLERGLLREAHVDAEHPVALIVEAGRDRRSDSRTRPPQPPHHAEPPHQA